MGKKLYKNKDRKMISGVLAGFSEYLDIDVTILRVGYVIVAIFTEGFPLLVLYIILAILLPEKDVAYGDRTSTSWRKDDTYQDNQGPSWKKDDTSWKKDEPSWKKDETVNRPNETARNPYDPSPGQTETPRERYKKAGGSYTPKNTNDDYGPEGYREVKEDDKN